MGISVITPTIRTAGLSLVKKSLERQGFTDFEWLICSPDKPEIIDSLPFSCLWLEDNFTGGYWSLGRAYNYLIKNTTGELIVSWQDYTFARPDALEKFWDCYQAEPKTLVSGVGNKYTDETWTVKTWQDPRQRKDMGSYYDCYAHDIEWNFCSCPKEALMAIGGFDEQLDFIGFGMDGVSVVDRIDTLGGYNFKLDQTNESYSLEHSRPANWEELNLLHGGYQQRVKELIDKGEYPVLNYL